MFRARVSIIAAVLIASALPAFAQSQYPDKPISMIVPQAPGSATDTIARMVAAEMGTQLDQTIIIENKPGAAFTIGLDIVAKAPPDGYTLGIGPIGALAISPNMVDRLPYDILKDFQPIALVSRGHLLLAVAPTSKFRSVKELVDKGKQNPGKLTNASSANGSPGHVGAELFKYLSRHRRRARAIPRRRGGHQRPDRGPRRLHVRKPQLDLAARQVGRRARAGGKWRPALAGVSAICRPSRRPG